MHPYVTSRCLIALQNIVQSFFAHKAHPILGRNVPISLQGRDPIVTAGNEKIRFEGFSNCNGAYGRVDILPDGHDGEFPSRGTTNVDFNQPLISALGTVTRADKLVFSVGHLGVSFSKGNEKIIERKVPLPSRWIKGLATVQHYLAASERHFILTRTQALQLFQSLPRQKTRSDYSLINRGNKPTFCPVNVSDGIIIGGIHRLKLIDPLLPYINELRIFQPPSRQSVTFQLYFDALRFTFSVSRDPNQGFSGDGAVLGSLLADLPEPWINAVKNFSYANQEFNPLLLSINHGLDLRKVEMITARLSALGLLGYDLDENHFFHRRLPFRLDRILAHNPRLKGADKLLREGKVEITLKTDTRIEAKVMGDGVSHFILIESNSRRCTCEWFGKHQAKRGLCKHIIAVEKKTGRSYDTYYDNRADS